AAFVGTLNTLSAGAPTDALLARLGLNLPEGFTVAIRPENLGLGGTASLGEPLEGRIRKFTYLGREAHLQVPTNVGDLVVHVANPSRAETFAIGATTTVLVPRDGLMAFDAGGARIATGGPA